MIIIKNKSSLKKMCKAGELLLDVFHNVKQIIVPGISTLEIDGWIEKQLRLRGLVPRTKGYSGYKHSSCISVNDALIHGVPCKDFFLKPGDLVTIDVIASWKGYCADMARSFLVDGGEVEKTEKIKGFVEVVQSALDKGIEMARSGNYLSDISFSIQKEVEVSGFSIVRDFAGHGIGKQIHEDPEVLNFGEPGKGPLLRSGMTLAIEPMITMGSCEVYVMDDGWTVKTRDKSLTAHVEDTVVITDGAPKILTRLDYNKGGDKG